MNNQTVAANLLETAMLWASVFAMIGLIAGEVHVSVARPAVSHVAHAARTASMPATTSSWTEKSNSYRSVGR